MTANKYNVIFFLFNIYRVYIAIDYFAIKDNMDKNNNKQKLSEMLRLRLALELEQQKKYLSSQYNQYRFELSTQKQLLQHSLSIFFEKRLQFLQNTVGKYQNNEYLELIHVVLIHEFKFHFENIERRYKAYIESLNVHFKLAIITVQIANEKQLKSAIDH